MVLRYNGLAGGAVPGRQDIWARAAFYAGLSVIIPVSALAGYGLGWYLDRRLHSAPILAFVGILAGSAAGIFDVIRIVIKREKNAGSG